MDENFKTALAHTLRFEGGYVDHPKDPGGATNFGITRKTLASVRGVAPWWKLPKSEVKGLQMPEVEVIYFERYWRPSGAHLLGAALAYVVFDFAVHSGPNLQSKSSSRLLEQSRMETSAIELWMR